MNDLLPIERIENRIFFIRGQKVMLDFDLAELYGVPTMRLNERVKRNAKRFPEDFVFSLTREEIMRISQIAISSTGLAEKIKFHKNINAFTEQGIAMLSSVLNSERAIGVNIMIMRAFVKIRSFLSTHKELAEKFRELEARVGSHDVEIGAIIKAIEKMLAVPDGRQAVEERPKKRIGFNAE